MAAAGVVALKFIIDFGGGIQRLFQAVRAHQRGGAVHFVKISDFVGNIDIRRYVVDFLFGKFFAKDVRKFFRCHRAQRFGVQQRRGFLLHKRAQVQPLLGQFVFFQINFVGNFFLHNSSPLAVFEMKKSRSTEFFRASGRYCYRGATQIDFFKSALRTVIRSAFLRAQYPSIATCAIKRVRSPSEVHSVSRFSP